MRKYLAHSQFQAFKISPDISSGIRVILSYSLCCLLLDYFSQNFIFSHEKYVLLLIYIFFFRREDSELGDGPDSRLSNYSNVSELVRAKPLDAVQLRFNLEAASLLPLVLR